MTYVCSLTSSGMIFVCLFRDIQGTDINLFVLLIDAHRRISSLAKWLRCPPRDWQTWLLPAFGVDPFLGRVIPETYNVVIQWLPCQGPGVIGQRWD